ncbi:MAG TPA: hypothetical protein PLR44_07145 [Thermomicrobiales bacterium]|nr:hypothetical protein [Chloroflexota bacterium]HCG29894.1 hypothetical protein [Chloroflexota bacterium]HQZ89813.1 hypothetical protein [Thermomicrobiales bacterium]
MTGDEQARTLTTELCARIQPDGADVGTVLRVYDWVRASIGAGEGGDIERLARMWQEQQSPDDWMLRAFGD